MGEEAEAILSYPVKTTTRKYETVTKKFDEFFKIWKNVIFQRALFNNRVQREGESIDEYIMDLYNLAENCEYSTGELKEEII